MTDREAIIVDLSIGGIQISHTTPYQFQQGSTVKVGLSIENNDFKVPGVIRRIWWRSAVRERKTSLEFVAIEFRNMDRTMADLLGKKVREAERLIRLKELFPGRNLCCKASSSAPTLTCRRATLRVAGLRAVLVFEAGLTG